MAEAVAHGRQSADGLVELIGFGGELPAVDPEASVGGEHACDLIERKAGGAAEGDEGQAVDDGWLKKTAQTSTATRCNQSFVLIEPQSRSGKTRALDDFADVEQFFS